MAIFDSFSRTLMVKDVDMLDLATEKSIIETTELFLGDINQIPPIHSAIKVDGQRVYKKARKGELVELKPRPVTIYEFEIVVF